MHTVDAEKKIRALRKKLAQIDKLKERDPTSLDTDAATKVACEDELRKEIAQFELQLKTPSSTTGPYMAPAPAKATAKATVAMAETPLMAFAAAAAPAMAALEFASDAADTVVSPYPVGPSPETEKRIRALNKKLAQIQQLKEKETTILDDEARQKIASEAAVRDEIAALREAKGFVPPRAKTDVCSEVATTFHGSVDASVVKDPHAAARAVELAASVDHLACDAQTRKHFEALQKKLRVLNSLHAKTALDKGQERKFNELCTDEASIIAELAALRAQFHQAPQPPPEDVHAVCRAAELDISARDLDLSPAEKNHEQAYVGLQAELREIGELFSKETLNESELARVQEQPHIIASLAAMRLRSVKAGMVMFDSGIVTGSWIDSPFNIRWIGGWINPFASLGQDAAACLPPPDPSRWHRPTYDEDRKSGTRDPAIQALVDKHQETRFVPMSLHGVQVLVHAGVNTWRVDHSEGLWFRSSKRLDDIDNRILARRGRLLQGLDTCDGWVRVELEGNLTRVQKWFKQPNDLNRWEVSTGGLDGDNGAHVSALALAFRTLNEDILDHLLQIAPLQFMQQMTMVTFSEINDDVTPFQQAMFAACRGRNEDDASKNYAKLVSVVEWMCWRGVMTDTIFADSWLQQTRGGSVRFNKGLSKKECLLLRQIPGVVAELERWKGLTTQEKRRLTEHCFPDILGPVIQNRVIVSVSLKESMLECHGINGDLLTSLELGDIQDTFALLSHIARALGTKEQLLQIITAGGIDLRKCDPKLPLSSLLG